MMRLMSDILPALMATSDGTLAGHDLKWRDEAALTVVLAARGYPGAYDKGTEIGGIAEVASDHVEVFHAGTKKDGTKLKAVGGRVLNVTALGDTITQARDRAYEAIDRIDWPQGFCRRDIGWRAVAREESEYQRQQKKKVTGK